VAVGQQPGGPVFAAVRADRQDDAGASAADQRWFGGSHADQAAQEGRILRHRRCDLATLAVRKVQVGQRRQDIVDPVTHRYQHRVGAGFVIGMYAIHQVDGDRAATTLDQTGRLRAVAPVDRHSEVRGRRIQARIGKGGDDRKNLAADRGAPAQFHQRASLQQCQQHAVGGFTGDVVGAAAVADAAGEIRLLRVQHREVQRRGGARDVYRAGRVDPDLGATVAAAGIEVLRAVVSCAPEVGGELQSAERGIQLRDHEVIGVGIVVDGLAARIGAVQRVGDGEVGRIALPADVDIAHGVEGDAAEPVVAATAEVGRSQ